MHNNKKLSFCFDLWCKLRHKVLPSFSLVCSHLINPFENFKNNVALGPFQFSWCTFLQYPSHQCRLNCLQLRRFIQSLDGLRKFFPIQCKEKQKSGCYNNIRGNKKGRNEWHYGGCNVRDNLLITNRRVRNILESNLFRSAKKCSRWVHFSKLNYSKME